MTERNLVIAALFIFFPSICFAQNATQIAFKEAAEQKEQEYNVAYMSATTLGQEVEETREAAVAARVNCEDEFCRNQGDVAYQAGLSKQVEGGQHIMTGVQYGTSASTAMVAAHAKWAEGKYEEASDLFAVAATAFIDGKDEHEASITPTALGGAHQDEALLWYETGAMVP